MWSCTPSCHADFSSQLRWVTNPDWAIAFKEGTVKHVYFVAETKGSMSSMDLREIEKTKIKCARKFFEEMNRRCAPENVKYDVVDGFGRLMEVVK